MSKLFVKDRVVPDYIFEDLAYDLKDITAQPSEVVDWKDGKQRTVKRDRSSLSKRIKSNLYLDLCKVLESFCARIDPKHIPENLIVKEFEHLEYGVTDHFHKHHDALPRSDSKRIRRFTTITLLSKADDLEGGDLLVFDEEDNPINTNLDVGETVVFYSTTMHQVTPITKGGREVLVGWIYDR